MANDGRHTKGMKYSKELTERIAGWIAANGLGDCGGATVGSLCSNFGISYNTLKSWERKADFKKAIEEAKATFAQNLEHDIVVSLAKAAKGYSFIRTRTELVSDSNGVMKVRRKVEESVDVSPNVGAAIFILTNIAPARWQNKQNQFTEIQGDLSLQVRVIDGGMPEIATSESDVSDE